MLQLNSIQKNREGTRSGCWVVSCTYKYSFDLYDSKYTISVVTHLSERNKTSDVTYYIENKEFVVFQTLYK